MPEVAFIVSERQHHSLRELAETLRYELGLQAVPSAVHPGGFPQHRPDLVYVLIDPRAYVAVEGEAALPDETILRRTIFVCAERPPDAGADDDIELLKRAGAVFVLDQRSVVAMHRLGVPARLLRPGYSRSLDRFDPDAERPIDVMFLGTHSLRRTRYLAHAARVLSRRNCLLQISPETASPGDTSSFLGEGRWPLLARTKVVIKLHRGEGSRLDWRGTLDAIHAGAVVVTEHASGIAPLVAGEHLLVAGPDSLPYVADVLLRHPERLASLRARAYERLSTWIPYALWASVLRAAIVEVVGEPVAPGALHGSPASRAPAAATEAATEGGAGGGAAPEDGHPGARALSRELDEIRRELTEARRRLAALQEEARAAAGAARVEVAHRSSAWESIRAPRLTVLTVLRGECAEIASTLDSLAANRLRDFELIVVDGGSAGETVKTVRRWLSGHPRVAATLLVPAVDRGTGAAANIGLDFARGPLCLILKPGQALYPRCLEVLAGTLEAMPNVAFAYPIEEVTGAPDAFVAAGGDYLTSFWGWDPSRLRLGNPISAPALIRTDRVRAVGGLAADPRLEGLEDYDLWCRIAERGWPGQLVAQELARRTASGSSAVLSAMRPTPGPGIDALMERSPGVMAGAFASGDVG